MPEVAAARIGEDGVELLFTIAPECEPPDPWTRAGDRWTLARDAEVQRTDAMAPYPALAAVGADADGEGSTWLLDLEAAGTCNCAVTRGRLSTSGRAR